ncbi:hypothetical protein P22_2478 [Propionispora sp. 2/2-37]|uniref:hypothetical protein n=1 Tax=Propionispora sp. 2/2-37 TaxID=1677858 RepID=UPI0006BB8632|nr:hypothetical protein [Propionispora sp. 2/2-37]CUH96388.1 hypothetical protein P22_2478 [Propionispora sp. 2/2-37]
MEPTQRNDFVIFIQDKFEEIQKLFARKNEGYGTSGDLFWNFRQTAKRLYPAIYAQDPYAAMFLVAETLVDKHNVAMAKGITVSECDERLMDRIVYSLLQLKMVYERSEGKQE